MNERVELKEKFYFSLNTISLFSFAQLETVNTARTHIAAAGSRFLAVAWPPQTCLRSHEAVSLDTRGCAPETCLVSTLKCL